MFRTLTFAVVASVLLVGAVMVAVLAQEQPKAPTLPEQPKAKVALPDEVKAAREGAKGDPQLQMASLIARSLAAQPAIAVAGDCVYVVKGNTLYQFAVDGLRLLAKAELEPLAEAQKVRGEAVKGKKLEKLQPDAAVGHVF
jgi:hypothetical protein